MANFCLSKELTKPFLQALKDGTLDPQKLAEATSAERHTAFAKIIGEGDAREVNALFESKLLLKNQQAGIINWAKSVGGIKPEVMRDLVSRISKMDKVLNAADQHSFLSDLAAKKLGTEVTHDEARVITQTSKVAQNAREALAKDPLNPEKQISYGRAFMTLRDTIDSMKPKPNIWTLTNVINLPKSALTSVLHFSAPFVQGRGLLATKPWFEAFGNQFSNYLSTEAYKNSQAAIIGHPDYPLALDGKLGLTRLGDKLSTREEALQSSLLEHVPGLKTPVLASSRAFTGFLNEVRFKNFSDLIAAAKLRGENVSKGSQTVKDIAQTVNNFSGRGPLGTNDRFAELGPTLNNFFFSPRKIIATMQMFNPLRYVDPRISTTAKIGAARYMTGQLITTAAMLELAHLSGASVNLDPTNTDFLKIRMGKTTLDASGGVAIYARLLGRLIEGKTTSSTNKVTSLTSGKYGSPTRLDESVSFFKNKLAPTAGMFLDFLQNQNPAAYGKPFNLAGEKGPFVTSEIYNKFSPIVIQQFINFARSDPQAYQWLPALAGIFGVEVNTPVQ